MSINRLRNVAVRMRPPTKSDDASLDDAPKATMPRRVVVSRPEPGQKKQIWDLEADKSRMNTSAQDQSFPQEPVADAEPAPAPAMPRAVAPVASKSAPVPSADATPPSRAKTRIIGFHAQEITAEQGEGTAPGPVYPAGFLVVINGPGRGAHFTVTTHVSTIGRGDDQDVCLDFGDESISRSGHASVMYDSEQNAFFLGHGNKANAVRRNDMPVLATEKLEHGDDIRIGKTTLRFHAFCGEDFRWDDGDDV